MSHPGRLESLHENLHWDPNCVFLFLRQADLNTSIDDEGSAFYGVSSQYESLENMIITCSTKVCSFGKQVVEKVEVGGHPVGAGPRGWPVCSLFLELSWGQGC